MHKLASLAALLFLTAAALAAPPAALDAKDFGAKADGTTDDTAALQRALDAAGKTGGRVSLPAGRYFLAGHLDIPECVTLEGVFTAPERTIYNTGRLEKEKGTILLATEGKGKPDGTPFITLHRASTVTGLIVFYPEQTVPIVEYPWCIRGAGDNCTVKDVLLINPYRAVDFGTQPAGRHYINGLYAQALKDGLFIDKCFDVGRVENVHFWPFWRDDKAIEQWMNANATAFEIARTDWEYMSDCFAIWYGTGYHFFASKDGPGNAVLVNCGSDVSPCSVRVDATQGHAGVSFVNGQFMAGVQIGEHNDGPVKFTACGFWGSGQTGSHLVSRSNGLVTFTACHFISWDQKKTGAPCLDAQRGSLTVNGCEFLDTDPAKLHIRLAPDVASAVIAENTFRAPTRIDNKSKGDVAIGLNVSTGAKK